MKGKLAIEPAVQEERNAIRFDLMEERNAIEYEQGDKEIELFINMVRQAAEAGIPAIKYYLCASKTSAPKGAYAQEIFMNAVIAVVFGLMLSAPVVAESLVEGWVHRSSGEPVEAAQILVFDWTDLRRGAVALPTIDAAGYFALPTSLKNYAIR